MKASINITKEYGMFHYWHLVLENKETKRSFYLGQDAKVCSRLLGMPPAVVVERIGTNDPSSPEGNQKLTELILEHILPEGQEVTELLEHPDWMFAVE